jgi:hypothetical protein
MEDGDLSNEMKVRISYRIAEELAFFIRWQSHRVRLVTYALSLALQNEGAN